MPFTPAHAAAALPFRRTRLILSAVVVGSFAPDFEFFLRLAPRGALLIALPAALVVLWLYHRWAKYAAVALMPQSLRARVADSLSEFRFGGPRRFVLIVASALVGIATHIAWDSFTHPASWLVQHSSLLMHEVDLPAAGPILFCRIVQHASTVAGLAILAVWFARWYRRTPPLAELDEMIAPRRRTVLWIVLPALAMVCAVLRIARGLVFAHSWWHLAWMLGLAAITWIAAIWWLLVAVGYFLKSARRGRALIASRHRARYSIDSGAN